MRELKSKLACTKCGENHPACLDFHHPDPQTKTLNVAEMTNQGWSKRRILSSLDGLLVLCANCHRKEHYNLRHTSLA